MKEDGVLEVLNSEKYTDKVREDEKEAAMLKVTGVPFFVIDNKLGISGAQPIELFKEALEKAL